MNQTPPRPQKIIEVLRCPPEHCCCNRGGGKILGKIGREVGSEVTYEAICPYNKKQPICFLLK
jgi:aspartate carbamoyltransferase regulatory subunit